MAERRNRLTIFWRAAATVLSILSLVTSPIIEGHAAQNKTVEAKSTSKTVVLQRFVDVEGKMSFMPPAGWTRDKQVPAPNIVFIAPDAQNGDVNIGVVSERIGAMTLNHFAQANRDFAAQAKGLSIFAEADVTLAGEQAHTWHMRVTPTTGKGPVHETRQIFCIHRGRSYVLTLAALPSNIKKYEPVFDHVVASFKFEK